MTNDVRWAESNIVFNPKHKKSEQELKAIARARQQAREIKREKDKARRE